MNKSLDRAGWSRRKQRKARDEIWSYREYYYLIINDDVKRAMAELQAVIIAERIRMKRMNRTKLLVSRLMEWKVLPE